MKIRAANFVAATAASILFSADGSAAPDAAEPTPAADQCLTSPRDYTPPGTRWRYRIERGSGRRCWFLKDDAEKIAGKATESSTSTTPSTATTEEPAAATSRRRSPATRPASDARAEFSQAPVEQGTGPAAAPGTASPATGTPPAATRRPSPMPIASPAAPAANPVPPPVEQSAEVRAAQPPAKPQAMPRAVPPVPVSEKPMSLPMLITIVAGGFSVFAVLVSMFLAWLASRKTRRAPGVAVAPLQMNDQPRRPGDLYRERQRLRARSGGQRAA
jgi:hypothetical protein